MTNQIVSTPGSFDFAATPLQLTIPTGSLNLVYSTARSQQGIAPSAVSPYSLWVNAVKPVNGTHILTPTNPFVVPLAAANLPPCLFDLILDLEINNEKYPIAVTNSPDNTIASEQRNDNNLFWLKNYRVKPNAEPGYVVTSNYHMGTESFTYSGAPVTDLIRINLWKPLLNPVTFNWAMTAVGFGAGYGPWSGTRLVQPSAGAIAVPIGDWPAGMTGAIPANAYYRLSVSCSDPTIASMLNFYHWPAA